MVEQGWSVVRNLSASRGAGLAPQFGYWPTNTTATHTYTLGEAILKTTSWSHNSAWTAMVALGLLAALLIFSPAANAAGSITVGGKALVTNTDGDTIRVREGAGTQYKQVAEAHEGQVVAVLAGP